MTVSSRSYITEISENSIRGAACTTLDLMRSTGCITITSLGILLPWYQLAFVSAGQVFLLGVVFHFLPESPTYLVVNNQEDEARRVLRRLRGSKCNVDQEVRLIKVLNERQDGSSGWRVLLKTNVLKQVVTVSCLLMITHFCGSGVVRSNTTRMLQTSGLTLDKDMSTIIVFFVLFCGSLVMVILVDRIGRRWCLLASLIQTALAYAVLGTFVYLTQADLLPREVNIEPLTATRNSSALVYYTTLR